jgi:hypothetical protein
MPDLKYLRALERLADFLGVKHADDDDNWEDVGGWVDADDLEEDGEQTTDEDKYKENARKVAALEKEVVVLFERWKDTCARGKTYNFGSMIKVIGFTDGTEIVFVDFRERDGTRSFQFVFHRKEWGFQLEVDVNYKVPVQSTKWLKKTIEEYIQNGFRFSTGPSNSRF